MKKNIRPIALILSIIMFLSVINIDISSAESLETRVSVLLNELFEDSKTDSSIDLHSESINIVKATFIGDDYKLRNKMVISYSILREYGLAVYVNPYKNTNSYRGEKNLRNGEYRYLGYRFDGYTPVTNPRYLDDATSSIDLRDKNWRIFNSSNYTYSESRSEQEKYLFQANLYDPVGSDKRPIGMNVKDILGIKVPKSDHATIKTYSQMGSTPTLNNEGSIMLKHKTSSGKEYYDSFVVDPLDIGASYNSVIVKNINEPNRYVLSENQDEITVNVDVRTTIEISEENVYSNVIFAYENQSISFKGQTQEARYDTDGKTLFSTFPITFSRDQLKYGDNVIDLSATTVLNSIYGDEVIVKGNGQITIVLPSSYLSSDMSSNPTADFDILKANDFVTDSAFILDGEYEKLIDDESMKEVIKRLDIQVDLTLRQKISVPVNSVNWFIFNNVTNNYEYIDFALSDITKNINRDNVDNYVDDEGKVKFKMYAIDYYGFVAEITHHTSIELNYQDVIIEAPSSNDPPIAIVRTANNTRAGSVVSFSASKSRDSDGYITDYSFIGGAGLFLTRLSSSGKSGYATPIDMGVASISVNVTDNSGASDEAEDEIIVISPINHRELFSGQRKVNRRITLDSTLDEGTRYYPSSEFETSWEITPLEGQSTSSIKWDTNNQGKLVDVLFKETGIYNIKKIVKAKCTYASAEGTVIVEERERGIKILEDQDPIAKFALVKYNLRKKLDDTYATIKVYDTSYSPDLDDIYKRTWYYKYDANNNGSFDDDVSQLFDSDNDLKEISLRVRDVGRYEFMLSVEEDFTEDTIEKFIGASDILTDNSDDMETENKFAEVLNVAPIVKLEEKANKKVDMIVVTDYLASERASLESDMSLLTKSMQEKKLNLIPHMVNMNDDGNSIVVGQKSVPVFKYSRYAQLHLQYDEKCITHQDNRDVNIVTTGDDAKASYPPLEIDSVLATEKEALSLPSYPNTYAGSIDPGGFSYSYNGYHTAQYYRMGSFKIYDEANLLRGFFQYPSDYRRTVESFGSTNYYLRSFGQAESYIAQAIRRLTVDVDREFIREEQVSTELEDIISINTDLIKNISLDENADKYLVILTKKEDTLKSIDNTFIEYAKSKGFIIRYSIPQLAMDQSARGYEFDDVRFKDESIILKSANKYFELGNVHTLANEIAMSPTSKASDIALFNTHDSDLLLPSQSIIVKMPNAIRVMEQSPYNWQQANTRFVYSNLIYRGNRIYGLGIDISGVRAVHYTKNGVLCEMESANVKYIKIKEKYNIIEIEENIRSATRYPQAFPNIASYLRNLELEVIDTGLIDVMNIKSYIYNGGRRVTSKERGKVFTENDYRIDLDGARTEVTDSNGCFMRSETYLSENGEYVQSWSNRRKIYSMTMHLQAYVSDYQRGVILDKNTVSIEGGIDFDKMYIKENYIVYIKDGSVYAKGRSNSGELGIVGYVGDFRKISDVTLKDESIDYVSALELNYNIQNKSYTSKDAVLSSVINDYNDYSTDETIYRLLGETLEMDTFYFDYEGDPHEDTRYDYTHTEIFDNSLGIDPLSGTSTEELVRTYDKVGRYEIRPRYRDNPKDISVFNNYWLWNQDNTTVNLIVHRKPIAIAKFTSKNLESGGYEIKLMDDASYDLDHISMDTKGITEYLWFVRDMETLNTTEYNTKEVVFNKNQSARLSIALKVKDLEGQWSDYTYMDIDDIPKPKISLSFEIKPVDENFSISDIPATEYLDIYDIETSHMNPISLEIYIENPNGVRRLISSYDSEILISEEGSVSGILKDDDETIEWTSINYHTLKRYNDGVYNVVIKGIDKTCETNFIEKRKPFTINTPINLSAVVPEEIISGSEYIIESYASKYTDKVRLKVYDRTDEVLLDSYMYYENTSSNARKKFTKELSSSSFDLEGDIRFEFIGIIDSEVEKSENLIRNSRYIDLAISNVRIYGEWSKWDGGRDLRGNILANNPRRFLSFERIFIEATTIGNPDKLLLDLSEELKSMSFTDDKGNIYRYIDFVKYEVEFPQEFTKISDNYWEAEYILPLANSTLSFEDDRLREAYSLSVIAEKSSSQIIYTIDKDSPEGGIEITGNVYDHFYIQKK